MTISQGLCTGFGNVENDLVDPEIRGSQISSGAFFDEAFLNPFLDGSEDVSFADIQKLGDLEFGLAAPRMIGTVGQLMDTVNDGVGGQR